MIITIDGPAGAGKSTIARLIAQKLELTYIDTGAIYRAITWLILKNNLDLNLHKKEILNLVIQAKIDLQESAVFLNGENITQEIRQTQIAKSVSEVSAIPEIRAHLLILQRELGKKGNVILDGRDIGTTVFPQADLKVFLVASIEERAKRRQKQQILLGIEQDLEEVKKDIERRDYIDFNREISPLRQASDAVLLDTDDLTIEEVIQKINSLIKKIKND